MAKDESVDKQEEMAKDDSQPSKPERRTFLSSATTVAMGVGLVGGYGGLGLVASRYLYPAKPTATAWVFVAVLAKLKQGDSMEFRTPTGARAVVAKLGDSDDGSDVIALSSVCPHLGCQVFWEANNDRFFCPCHNGTFDRSGKGTGGPPGKAGQSLLKYPLKVEEGLLYMQVPLEELTLDETGNQSSNGQPCQVLAVDSQRSKRGKVG